MSRITERNVEGRFEDERKKELCRQGRVAASKTRKFRKEWNILEVNEVHREYARTTR